MVEVEMEFISPQEPMDMLELHEKYLAEYQRKKDRRDKEGVIGLITGFKAIDENCAFEANTLAILAAKTSIGKMAFALNIAINAAMFGHKVIFFSAEMKINSLLNRVYSQLTNVSATRFKYANADGSLPLVENELKACGKNIKFVEAIDLSSSDVCRIVNQHSKKYKPDLVIVDYLQYLKDEAARNESNNDKIGRIVKALKALSFQQECTVLALSQVNRAATGIPELQNLRASGNIEQEADIVLILHRDDRDSTTAQVVIAKNREGQADLSKDLKFNPKLTKFYE